MAADSVTAAINKVKIKAGIQKLLGWIIAIFNGLIAFVGSTQISEALDVVLVTFFAGITALGIFLIYKGSKKTKLVKAFYDYSARLAADPEKSIDLLASSTGVTVAAATKNISEMLALGFFPNCFLDTQHNRLVMPDAPQAQAPAQPAGVPRQGVKYTTIQCRNCGATNKIAAGAIGECEFCGSQISE